MWAILGSISALLYFLYNNLKANDDGIDMILCYNIVSVFTPVVLYIVCLYEMVHSYQYGNSWHVRRLIDAAPLLTMCYNSSIYLLLIIVGLLVQSETMIMLLWGIVLFVNLICLVSVLLCRDKLVSSFGGIWFANNTSVNRVLSFLFFGVILCPVSIARQTLTLGVSMEFEYAIVVVLLIVLCYTFLRFFCVDSYSRKLDVIIDGYLYREWSKRYAMDTYETLLLGKRPFELLQKRYYALIDSIQESVAIEMRVSELKEMVMTGNLSNECLSTMPDILKNYLDSIRRLMEIRDSFFKGVEEMLDIKGSIHDKDFIAMVETMASSRGELSKTFERLMSVQCMIQEIMEMVNPILDMWSCTRDCPMRCDKVNESKKDDIQKTI